MSGAWKGGVMFLPPGRNLVVRARFRFCMGKRSILRELRFVRERHQQRGRQSAAGPVVGADLFAQIVHRFGRDGKAQSAASGRVFRAGSLR